MIEITKYKDGFTIRGHAGFAESGKDIVCAAISTLAENFITSWDVLSDDVLKSHSEPGYADIEYDTELSDVSKTLISSFFIGVECLRNAYPEYVGIIDEMSNT